MKLATQSSVECVLAKAMKKGDISIKKLLRNSCEKFVNLQLTLMGADSGLCWRLGEGSCLGVMYEKN